MADMRSSLIVVVLAGCAGADVNGSYTLRWSCLTQCDSFSWDPPSALTVEGVTGTSDETNPGTCALRDDTGESVALPCYDTGPLISDPPGVFTMGESNLFMYGCANTANPCIDLWGFLNVHGDDIVSVPTLFEGTFDTEVSLSMPGFGSMQYHIEGARTAP